MHTRSTNPLSNTLSHCIDVRRRVARPQLPSEPTTQTEQGIQSQLPTTDNQIPTPATATQTTTLPTTEQEPLDSIPSHTMVGQNEGSTPQNPPHYTNMGVSVTIASNRFSGDGTGLSVHAFIAETENRIKAMNVPVELFEQECLKTAIAHLDMRGPLQAIMDRFDGAPDEHKTWQQLKSLLLASFSPSELDADLLLTEIYMERPTSFSESTIRDFINKLMGMICRWAKQPNSQFQHMQGEIRASDTYRERTKAIVMLVIQMSITDRDTRRRTADKLKSIQVEDFPRVIATTMKHEQTQTHIAAAASHLRATHVTPPPPQQTRQTYNNRTSYVQPARQQNNTFVQGPQQHKQDNSFVQPPPPQRNNAYSQPQQQQRNNRYNNNRYNNKQPQRYNNYNSNQGAPQHKGNDSINFMREAANPNFFPKPNQCFKCLQTGHRARDCPNVGWCPYHEEVGHSFIRCRNHHKLAQKVMEKLGNQARLALSHLEGNQNLANQVSYYGMQAVISAEDLQDIAEF